MRGTKWLGAAVLLAIATPGVAQFSDSYNYMKAVRDRNGDDLAKITEKPSFTGFDTRDPTTGETALHIVTRRRDITWLRYLMGKGAGVNLKDRTGATPLFDAATVGWAEGASALLEAGARVDLPNDNGETPLMRAVQARDADTVRVLLDAGANPDVRDHLSGKSAKDYATTGRTDPAVLKLLQTAKAPHAAMGPHL